MVVFKIDINCIFADPTESDPVVGGNPNRPAFWVALQHMKAQASDVQVFRTHRRSEQLQDAHALPKVIGADPASLAREVNVFKTFVSEAIDRTFSLSGRDKLVN